MVSAKQMRGGMIHTSRTAMVGSLPTDMLASLSWPVAASQSAHVTSPHRGLTEPANRKTVGVVSLPIRGPMHGAFTPCAPARSPRTVRRWTLRRLIRDDRP